MIPWIQRQIRAETMSNPALWDQREDIEQEVLISLWRAGVPYEESTALGTTIIRRRVVDAVRRSIGRNGGRRVQVQCLGALDWCIDTATPAQIEPEAVLDLSALSERDQIIVQRSASGVRQADIALEVGLIPYLGPTGLRSSRVSVLYHRALRRLEGARVAKRRSDYRVLERAANRA